MHGSFPLFLLFGLVLLLAPSCARKSAQVEEKLRFELEQALQERSYGKAAQLARRAVALKSQDNGSWDRLVQAHLGLHDSESAKRVLEEWRHTVKKTSIKLEEYTGDLAFEQHEPARAVQAWSEVLRTDPKQTRVLEKLAHLENGQKHWEKENAAWTAHIDAQDTARARINRAFCQRRLHRWPEAFDDLRRAQELSPDDPEVVSGGKLFEQIGKFMAEIRDVDASLTASPDDPGLLMERALISLRSGDYELALEDSEEATRFGPWATKPRLLQAIALINLGRPDEAEKLAVRKSIQLKDLTSEFLETIGRLDSEISVEPGNAELCVSRAWQLNEIGQPALALQDTENAARLNPTSASAAIEASYALAKLNCTDEALQQIKHAIELDPTVSTAWQYRGELEMERGETLSAIESLSLAIEKSRTVEALQKREQCYRRLGLLVKAEEDRRTLAELTTRAPR